MVKWLNWRNNFKGDPLVVKITHSAVDKKLSYQDIIRLMCVEYSKKHLTARFMGYNTLKGSQMYGTLKDISPLQLMEMPVAENLMMGMAVGMAATGKTTDNFSPEYDSAPTS